MQQDLICFQKHFHQLRIFGCQAPEAIIGYGNGGIHHFFQSLEALVSQFGALFAFERKRFGNHCHCQGTHIFADLGDYRGRAGSGAASESRGDKYHVTVAQRFAQRLLTFEAGIAADLGIGSSAKTFGQFLAHLNFDGSPRNFKGLAVGIGCNEFYALQIGCDHIIDCVTACAADTNYFNFC